jgi:hypothetical protein
MNRKIKKFKKQDSEGPTMFIPSTGETLPTLGITAKIVRQVRTA